MMDIKELLKYIELTPEQIEDVRDSLKQQGENHKKQIKASTSTELLNRTYGL